MGLHQMGRFSPPEDVIGNWMALQIMFDDLG